MLPPLAHDRRITIVDYHAQLFIAELARSLAERGHDITYIYCASHVKLPFAVAARLRKSGVHVDDVSIGSPNHAANGRLPRRLQVRLGLALAGRVRTGTVIGIQLPLITNWMLLSATRFRSNRYINWVQGFQTKRSFFTRRGVANRPSRFERYQIRSAHQVLCASDELTMSVLNFGRQGPTSTISNWAPLDLISTCRRNNNWAESVGLDETRFWVTHSGPLESQHRVGDISRIVKQLLHYDKFEFVFTGEGEGYEELVYDTALSLSPRVHFLGPRQAEVLPQILGAANVLLATLDPESVEHSVSETVLSYLCAGRPIVGLMDDCCASAEAILDAEAGTIVSTADSFTDAIIKLAEDSESALLAGKRGRAYAERFFETDVTTTRFVDVTGLGVT